MNTEDKIIIEELKIYAYHGVLEEEKQFGQEFVVNACLYLSLEKAGLTDDLNETVNYAEVCAQIEKSMTSNKHDLIEKVAQKTAVDIMNKFPMIDAIDLEIRKPKAPIDMKFGCVSVKIHRGWKKSVISIGSNMGDSSKIIENAYKKIKNEKMIRNVTMSSIIKTKPYGYTEQDDFLNGIIVLDTLYSPYGLLDFLHTLEQDAGRERLIHWGPRTLDLDIVFFGDMIINDVDLIVPHPDMHNREFVLKPLCEVEPRYMHPIFKKTASELLSELTQS